MAALAKKRIGVGFLEVAAADFAAGNLRGNGQNRNAAAVGIVESVDQVRIPRPAASGAHSEFPGEVRLRARGKSGRFFMTDVNPLHRTASSDNVGNAVERIPRYTIDALHPRMGQSVYQQFAYGLAHVALPPDWY